MDDRDADLLDATLLTPFPGKMGGIVFCDMQLIQRATDGVIVGLVILAAGTIFVAHRRHASTSFS